MDTRNFAAMELQRTEVTLGDLKSSPCRERGSSGVRIPTWDARLCADRTKDKHNPRDKDKTQETTTSRRMRIEACCVAAVVMSKKDNNNNNNNKDNTAPVEIKNLLWRWVDLSYPVYSCFVESSEEMSSCHNGRITHPTGKSTGTETREKPKT